MRKQLGRQALESTIVNCPHGIVAHILHDPYGLLTLPHRARLYRMTNRFDEITQHGSATPVIAGL